MNETDVARAKRGIPLHRSFGCLMNIGIPDCQKRDRQASHTFKSSGRGHGRNKKDHGLVEYLNLQFRDRSAGCNPPCRSVADAAPDGARLQIIVNGATDFEDDFP